MVRLLMALVAAALAVAGRAKADDFIATGYDLTLTPDFAKHSVVGDEQVRIRSQQDGLAAVTFTANALIIGAATVADEPASAVLQPDGWRITLPHPLAKGAEVTLTIYYQGVPARSLVFGPHSVHTSYFTCDWMFCNEDRPGEKAPITLALVVPEGMTGVATGVLARSRPAGPGLTGQVWREPRPYSAYLYGFAIGDYQSVSQRVGAVTLTYFGEATPPARLSALFAASPGMLRFLEDKAGAPPPRSRYAQLLVPEDDAQEAAGFGVIGEPDLAPALTDPTDDWVIVHEMAHQWWGNLVTCRTWSELWLNEGITSFLVAAWKQHRWGEAAYQQELDRDRARAAAAAKAGFDEPLAWAGQYPSLSVRRDIQYFKGALFMDALRRELGEAAFWRGLRNYTRAHLGGVVTSRDFQRAMQQASGRDLSGLFNRWVYPASA